MNRKAAQEANQHRKSVLRLCFERMFVATHGGKRSRSDRSGWDCEAGIDSIPEGFGEAASKEGVLGFEDMKHEEGESAHTPMNSDYPRNVEVVR